MQSVVTDDTCRAVRHSGGPEQSPGMVQSQISAIGEAIAQRIGQDKYRIWFKNSTTLTLADGYLKMGVPNPFIATWIENHFSNEIAQAAAAVTGATCKVVFNIDPQLAARQRPIPFQTPAQPSGATANPTPAWGAERQGRPVGRQIKMTLDTFVVGPSNELAYNAVKAVVNDSQNPFNPLFIHGGYGVGKTHLLQGICSETRKTRPGANLLYLSAEDFANQFVLALKSKKLEAFRRRMRQTDLLAIDDIHFLASKTATQEEFLHTFNTIDLAGKQVVLASDAHPRQIDQLSEKLVNRFISGMVVKIDPPDFAMRCEICKRYSVELRKHVPEGVIQYIAEHLKSNVRELQGAILKLVAFSSLANSKIDLAMAHEILAEHVERCDPIVHVSDIASAVAEHFGITPADIRSAKKDRTVALARHFSMYLARKHTKMSLTEIGRCMGDKNHATVLMACRRVDGLLKIDSQLHWQTADGNRVSRAKIILARLEKTIAA